MKKKKSKKGKKVGRVKAMGIGLEDFLDWADPIPPTRETQGVCPVLQTASEPAVMLLKYPNSFITCSGCKIN